jgi:hypothetical protein
MSSENFSSGFLALNFERQFQYKATMQIKLKTNLHKQITFEIHKRISVTNGVQLQTSLHPNADEISWN